MFNFDHFCLSEYPLVLKTQFSGMHRRQASSVYFLVGWGGMPLLVCTLYFLSLMGQAPRHFLPGGVEGAL